MSHLTKSDRYWHRIYTATSDDIRAIIDDAYSAVSVQISTSPVNGESLNASGDDRAEALVAAVARFVFSCNPNHPAVIAALEAAEKEGV